MAILSHKLRGAYFDITKVGTTTIKTALWRLEHGADFDGSGFARLKNKLHYKLAAKGLARPRSIHETPGWQNEVFALARQGIPEGYAPFTMVRDPAARLKSAWRDKVHEAQFAWRGELMDLRGEGLPTDPTFGEFIDHFEAYRMVSRPVRVHTTAYAWHLGDDLSFFDHVFRLEEISALQAWFDERAGHPVWIPHANKSGGRKAARDDRLSPAQIDRVFTLMAPDYALLGPLYDIDAARAKFSG